MSGKFPKKKLGDFKIINKDENTSKTLIKPEIAEKQRKRHFAAITDATSLILKHIEFPVNRSRNIICALQGVANGREEFQAAHLTLARRIGHDGKKKTAEMSVYRELKVLKTFQSKSQILIFDIEQGGLIKRDGVKIQERTKYYDYLTPAASWLATEASKKKKEDARLQKEPLGKIMETLLDEARGMLRKYAGSRLEQTATMPKINAGSGRAKRRKKAFGQTSSQSFMMQAISAKDYFGGVFVLLIILRSLSNG